MGESGSRLSSRLRACLLIVDLGLVESLSITASALLRSQIVYMLAIEWNSPPQPVVSFLGMQYI